MAEAENWQRYGPFDLGMHDYMEFDFREKEEELWRIFPTLDDTVLAELGKHILARTNINLLYSVIALTWCENNKYRRYKQC